MAAPARYLICYASAALLRLPRIVFLLLCVCALASAVAAAENHAPILAPIGPKETTEGSTLTFTLSAKDEDGDTITYTASGLPEGASVDASSGTFAWKPSLGQAGSYMVTLLASDSDASASLTVAVTCYNAPSSAPFRAAATPSPTEVPPEETPAPEVQESVFYGGESGDDGIFVPRETITPTLFYGSGTPALAAEQASIDDTGAPPAAGATRRVLLSVPGVATSERGDGILAIADPSLVDRAGDDLRFHRDGLDVSIATDGLAESGGRLAGRVTSVDLAFEPMRANLTAGQVSSSAVVAATSLPDQGSSATVSLVDRLTRDAEAAFRQAAADAHGEIAAFAAVFTVSSARLDGRVTASITLPAAWVDSWGCSNCRIVYVRPDGSQAAILPTSAVVAEGNATFTASAMGPGSFALAAFYGGNLPAIDEDIRFPVVEAEAPRSAPVTDVYESRPERPASTLLQLLLATCGAYTG